MTTSASHSWLIHARSLANEYGSAPCTAPARTMSRPNVRWPQRSASGAVPARKQAITRSATNDSAAAPTAWVPGTWLARVWHRRDVDNHEDAMTHGAAANAQNRGSIN